MRFYTLLLLIVCSFTACQKNQPKENNSTTPTVAVASLLFEEEGKLKFFGSDTTKVLKEIKIELADSPEEQEQGMMFRKEMPADTGMLFTFPDEAPRSFWMANTYLSLDIIYVNASKEIVSIARNAPPLSTESIPSEKPAKYVIEVPAGYTDTNGIIEGQKVNFSLR